MLCDAFIPISRLFDRDPSELTDSSKDSIKEVRHFILKREKLWNNGETFGQYTLKLKTENSQFVTQMSACARTEDGIISMVPLIQNYGINSEKRRGKLTLIQESILKIEEKNM